MPAAALVAALLACLTGGCSSSHTTGAGTEAAASAGHIDYRGVIATLPAGWRRIRLVGLRATGVPLEVASFRPADGKLHVGDPRRLRDRIPAGEALLQLAVRRPGEGGLDLLSLRSYEPLRRPFRLGAPRPHEFSEAYNLFLRLGGRALQARIWTAPGLPAGLRTQIERFFDSLRVAGSRPPRLSPPVGPRTVGPAALRKAILAGLDADFAVGTGAGPPHFRSCLETRLRRALDRGALASLVAVYRRPDGYAFADQALGRFAAPLGKRCGGARFVPEMIDAARALRLGRPYGRASRRLGVSYGPYLGVSCEDPDSTRCDEVGIDVVLKGKATRVSAAIAGRRIPLRTPGPHSGVRGRDWVGTLPNAGLEAPDSPLYVRRDAPRGGAWYGYRTAWFGYPPVYVPVTVSVTRANGRRLAAAFPHVFLSPGWG